MRAFLFLILTVQVANAGQSTALIANDISADIRLWIGGIAFFSSMAGVLVSHYFSSKRDNKQFKERQEHEEKKLKEERNYEKKGIISALLAEARYLKKQADTRSIAVAELHKIEKASLTYLSAVHFHGSDVYKVYLGKIAYLGEMLAGQIIRFQSTIGGYNDSIRLLQENSKYVGTSTINTLEVQLNNIHNRADLVIALLAVELEEEGSKENLKKIIDKI